MTTTAQDLRSGLSSVAAQELFDSLPPVTVDDMIGRLRFHITRGGARSAMAASISERCEIDLSPGTSATPFKGPDLRDFIGCASPWPDMVVSPCIPGCLIAQADAGVHGPL